MDQPTVDLLALNPQPLPPDAKIKLVALNPQPLPPDATIVATRPLSRPTSPRPSGCTRFDRKTTYAPLEGSIHRDVPVNPVCPKEPGGKRSPRLREYAVATSKPSARRSSSP